MIKSQKSSILKNLGIALNSEIKLIANLYLIEQTTTNKSTEYNLVNYTCLLGKSELFIFNKTLTTLELLIPYYSIQEILVDKFNCYSIVIKINESFIINLLNKKEYYNNSTNNDVSMNNNTSFNYNSNNRNTNSNINRSKRVLRVFNSTDLYIFIRNRNTFVKKIACYYSIFYLYKLGKIKELVVNVIPIDHFKRFFINTSTEIKHNPPNNYGFVNLEGYCFLAYQHVKDKKQNNVFYLSSVNNNANNEYSSIEMAINVIYINVLFSFIRLIRKKK